MLLRPIRTLFLIFVAFWVGVLYERFELSEKCQNRDGRVVDGICYGNP